jgi:predicted house-cleaning NTP pyrophosphatase (Maf/HAM1 superfamily)
LGRKKLLGINNQQNQVNKSLNLKSQRLSCAKSGTGTALKIILGSNSPSSKLVMDSLNWNYESLSLNVNGTSHHFIVFCTQQALLKSFLICLILLYFKMIEKLLSAQASDPCDLCLMTAKTLSNGLVAQFDLMNEQCETLLVCSYQLVVLDGCVCRTPQSDHEATELLFSLSNNMITSFTAVVVTHIPSGLVETGVDSATVYMGPIPESVIKRVVARGELFHTPGGLVTEDVELNPLLRGIDGAVDSVLGLPAGLAQDLMDRVVCRAGASASSSSSSSSSSTTSTGIAAGLSASASASASSSTKSGSPNDHDGMESKSSGGGALRCTDRDRDRDRERYEEGKHKQESEAEAEGKEECNIFDVGGRGGFKK